MITRTAIYEGKVRPGHEEEFFRLVGERLDPIWRQFPNVAAVRVQRIVDADADAPTVGMIMEMDFADRAAMKASLEGPVRERAHAATLEVMKLFDGRFYHLVAEQDQFGPVPAGSESLAPSGG